MVEIREVKTRKQLKEFATFPLKLYKNCPYYVPSLRSDEMSIMDAKKNHNLKYCDVKCFLAYKDGKLVGRIAGIIHREVNRIWNKKSVRFSRFEAINDLEVFKALLSAVKDFGKQEGMSVMQGPWGFNDTDREGMLTEGFDRVSTYATNYYYPYFSENMRKLGYEDDSKWIEMQFTIPKIPYEKPMRLAEKLKERYKVKDVTEEMSLKKVVKTYGDEFFETFNQAYKDIDGFVPIAGEEKENVLKQFATVINPRYFSLLIDEKGHCAGFAVVLPSLCKALKKHGGKLFPIGFIDILRSIKHPKELEMALIGVRDDYKNSGINGIMITKIMLNVMKDGITHIESNPMLESNYNIRQNWKFAECEVIKKRQTYKIDI